MTYNEIEAVPVRESHPAQGGHEMDLVNNLGAGFLVAILALLGTVLIGSLGNALRLNRWHPSILGAAVGALLGIAIIEAIPMLV
jgi:zinc transporter ZupT